MRPKEFEYVLRRGSGGLVDGLNRATTNASISDERIEHITLKGVPQSLESGSPS